MKNYSHMNKSAKRANPSKGMKKPKKKSKAKSHSRVIRKSH